MVLDAFTIGGVVHGGRIELVDRDAYQLAVAELPEGLCVDVTIASDDAVPSPSERQRAYWWGVVVPPLAQYFGTKPREVTRDVLGEVFGYERNPLDKWVPVKASLSWLTADEMSRLIDWTITWARTVALIEIPAPEKEWREKGTR